MRHFTLALLLILTFSMNAQDDNNITIGEKFTISGSADIYFKSNITGPNEAFEEDEETFFLNPGTSFADRNGFSFGMANVVLTYEGNKVGVVADLVFGPRGEDAVFLSSGSSNFVNQLYAYWNATDKLTVTLGNFNTFLGYELISPTGNFNYSTSYMFSNGPFSHTGVKLDYAASDELSFMLSLMNSTDFTEINLDGSYTVGAQIGYKSQYLNFIYGDQTGTEGTTFQIDFTGGTDLSSSFFLGVNATYNDTEGNGFYGAALYPQYKLNDNLALGVRGEYFGVKTEGSSDESVFATTLSANYTIDDLTLIPELRLDSWTDDVYVDNNMDPTNQLASFLMAAVYKF